mgnify:CR=1 FL=1
MTCPWLSAMESVEMACGRVTDCIQPQQRSSDMGEFVLESHR